MTFARSYLRLETCVSGFHTKRAHAEDPATYSALRTWIDFQTWTTGANHVNVFSWLKTGSCVLLCFSCVYLQLLRSIKDGVRRKRYRRGSLYSH
jgi:hypothetical protein